MRLTGLCLALIASLLVAEPAFAARISRDEAVVRAQKATGGGRVLAIDKIERNGQEVYRVKVLTGKGEIRVVLVDGDTGAVE